jgi:hypothetical protein
MRTFLLKIQADLENCTDVEPLDHQDYAHDYGLIFECDRCGYKHPKEVLVNRFEVLELVVNRLKRKVNFLIKCKDCHNAILIILTKPDTKLTQKDSKEGNAVPILEIHTHGCIITDFVLEDQFQCKSSTGEIFEEVDLRRGEWSEFDEKNNIPMSITNCKFELEAKAGNSTVTSL